MSHSSWKQAFRDFVNSVWAPLLIGGLIILLLVGNHILLMNRDNPVTEPQIDYSPVREGIQQRLSEILIAHEIPYKKNDSAADGPEIYRVSLPADVPVSDFHTAIKNGLRVLDADILSSVSDPVSGRLTLCIGQQDTNLVRMIINRDTRKRQAGRIAIIIDDFGERNDAFARSFLELPGDITISVIPGRNMSETISRIAGDKGCEVMLHLPMEPLKGAYPNDGYTLLGEMTQEQVQRIFRMAVEEVPGMAGFNNHMGSRVTADRRIMTYLMNAAHETDFYFVDSRTTAETVAFETAASFGIPCAKRDVFLDARNDKASIQRQMNILAGMAERSGYAIGIGHCNRPTLEVLREEIPKLQEKRFRFVRISEVVM